MKKSNNKFMSYLLSLSLVTLNSSFAYALETTAAPLSTDIVIENNVGKSDSIYINGLRAFDVVKIYDSVRQDRIIGTAAVTAYKSDLTINIPQIGSEAGSVMVSVTSKGFLESYKTKVEYFAELRSEAPVLSNITVVNNPGKADTINVTGLSTGDMVKVYSSAIGGKLFGSGSATASKGEVTVTVSQVGINDASIFVSVTSKGMLESERVKVDFFAEPKTQAISPENVIVVNNSGITDIIYVMGAIPGDIVKVYSGATNPRLMGSGTVPNGKIEIAINIFQLGATAGSVYVSATSKQMLESEKIKIDYESEIKSDPPYIESIIVANNSGKSDTVTVSGLIPGDIIKVYKERIGGRALGSAAVSNEKSQATVSVYQIGSSAGSIYISITSTAKQESERVKYDFEAEMKTPSPAIESITINNNVGKTDTVTVTGVVGGVDVKIFNLEKGGSLLGTGKVLLDKSDITINVAQLSSLGSSLYVSLNSPNMAESDRIKVEYDGEPKSSPPDVRKIVIANNSATSDIVDITGLAAGDNVKVYAALKGGTPIGSGIVSAGKTEISLPVTQLGIGAGSCYVTVTSNNKLESIRTKTDYSSEQVSSGAETLNIVVSNNAGGNDTIYVSGVTAGDVIKAYDSSVGGKLLGSALVSVSKTDGTISLKQLGATSGSVYISVTSISSLESERTKCDYTAETISAPLSVAFITINNNAGVSDNIKVSRLTEGDLVKVYDLAMGGKILGSATVAVSSTEAIIAISQLGTASGSVYFTITNANKQESERTAVNFSSETKTSQVDTNNITINNNNNNNNAIGSDIIKISKLSAGDVVKIYDGAITGNLIGSGTVATSTSELTISISQLGTTSGSVYVTNTTINKLESERTKADYLSEGISNSIGIEYITSINNAGSDDSIWITRLTPGDVVKVYDSELGSNLLGKTTVPDDSTQVNISIKQLGTMAGSVYIALTNCNKLEGSRTKVDYVGEMESNPALSKNISIVNKSGLAGIVTTNGLTGMDIVKIYDSLQGGTLLGTGSVGIYETSNAINVTQLGAEAGSVYVTVTSKGKFESTRTKADFSGKVVSSSPVKDYVTINNNAGIQDSITVTGLDVGDIVNIYDTAETRNLLGSSTVSVNNMKTTITINQLGSAEGSIYVSKTSIGKIESLRTKVDYELEAKTAAPAQGNILIANNAVGYDMVSVYGLADGDTIKVYNQEQGGTLLGSAAVSYANNQEFVNIRQLGTGSGSVYVSVTGVGKNESDRTKANYIAESVAPLASNITIENNAVVYDTIKIISLMPNDVVRIYDAANGGNLLGSGNVGTNENKITINVAQLTPAAGSIYVSVVNFGKGESNRTKVDYIAEGRSNAIFVGNIFVINNAGMPDSIRVSGLSVNDMIKIYDSETGGNMLGYVTATGNSSDETILFSQLGSISGSVYVSVTRLGKTESLRTKADYTAETISNAIFEGNIIIQNNAGTSDTVTVNGVVEKDVIKIYDTQTSGNLIGTAMVGGAENKIVITIPQLGASSGRLFLCVVSWGKIESVRTEVYYTAE